MQNNIEQKFIYHYTSLENAMNIIQSGRLVFWGSRYDCMNDPFDSIYSKKILLDELKKHGFENFQEFPDFIPYIVSFSKNRDDALMWRLYNAQVCLNLYRRKIADKYDSTSNFECSDCSYLYRKQILLNSDKILEKHNKSKEELWEKVCRKSAFIKHPDFKCEDEVRVVNFSLCRDQQNNRCDKRGEINDDFKFKKVIRPTKIVYYKEFTYDIDTLGGIIVKANNNSEFNDIKEHLKMWLYKCGIEYVSPNFIYQSKRVPVKQ